MRKMIIMVLAAGMLLPSLGAAVQNRFISDTWGEHHTLALHDSGAFALVKEEFRDQETYSWMRLRTGISARYGEWTQDGQAIILEFDDGTTIHAVPAFDENMTLGFDTEDGFYPFTAVNSKEPS